MKTFNLKYYIYGLSVTFMVLFTVSCSTRDIDKLQRDTQYSTASDVFIDGFSGGEDFNAWGDVYNFHLDNTTVYDGTASIRIDVPNSTDPQGSWAGGNIFSTSPRNLSGYDCLTFYAKSSVATTLTAGFGNGSIYNVSASLSLNTTWTKFIIPIPDASKLTAISSMFYYSAAPLNNSGYSIYIDDVKFEKLGTLAHPTILDSLSSSVFLGKIAIGNVPLSVNLPTGANQKISAAPAYFTFSSSNTSVAKLSSDTINVVGAGISYITAKGFEGSLRVNSTGIGAAPNPTYAANSVLSIFSDSYSSATIYNFWCGATQISKVYVGSNVMYYFTSLDWTCMVTFNATTNLGYPNASGYKYLHIDAMTPNSVTTSSKLGINLGDYTASTSGTSTPIYTYTYNSANKLNWIQLDIPVSSYSRSKVGYITFAGTNLTNLYVDNVYFHN